MDHTADTHSHSAISPRSTRGLFRNSLLSSAQTPPGRAKERLSLASHDLGVSSSPFSGSPLHLLPA